MKILDNIQYVFIAIIIVLAIFRRDQLLSFWKYRLLPHVSSFWLPWLFVLLMVFTSWLNFPEDLICLSVLMFGFVMFLLFKPMNIIHGLIGTRGDIRLFFVMFFVINLLFSVTYFYGFFKNSGITYDLGQPHVEFKVFDGQDKNLEMIKICPRNNVENVPENCHESEHYYHRIRYKWVLQNTLLTSLMQEPTEFYSFSCTYCGNHDEADRNIYIANCFNWFLVFHILISWVLLGVFISLIYQKFRNN